MSIPANQANSLTGTKVKGYVIKNNLLEILFAQVLN
jgi:hypothetical protein